MEQVKSITSKYTTEILFYYWLGGGEKPSNEVWKDLDAILNTDVFKPLMRVDVACATRDSDFLWYNTDNFDKAGFPTLLPNVSKKGILVY